MDLKNIELRVRIMGVIIGAMATMVGAVWAIENRYVTKAEMTTHEQLEAARMERWAALLSEKMMERLDTRLDKLGRHHER